MLTGSIICSLRLTIVAVSICLRTCFFSSRTTSPRKSSATELRHPQCEDAACRQERSLHRHHLWTRQRPGVHHSSLPQTRHCPENARIHRLRLRHGDGQQRQVLRRWRLWLDWRAGMGVSLPRSRAVEVLPTRPTRRTPLPSTRSSWPSRRNFRSATSSLPLPKSRSVTSHFVCSSRSTSSRFRSLSYRVVVERRPHTTKPKSGYTLRAISLPYIHILHIIEAYEGDDACVRRVKYTHRSKYYKYSFKFIYNLIVFFYRTLLRKYEPVSIIRVKGGIVERATWTERLVFIAIHLHMLVFVG